MVIIKILLLFIGVFLFLGGIFFYIYIRIKLKPMLSKDLEDYYYEFEDQHPGLQKYDKLSNLAKMTSVMGVIFLFIVIAI